MNKLTEWLVKPFIKEEFGAPAGTLPSPSQKKRKKAKKRLDKTGQRSVYSDSEIGESLPIKVTDKIKKVENKPETDAEKDFSQHHKYSLSAPMGSLSEPDTYDWDDDYKEKGLIVLGVPSNQFGGQEPGSNKEIKDFCEVNFNINFPMTSKYDVKGVNAHPIYKWAKETFGKSTIPKWNFHKILINKDGRIIDTYSSFTNPLSKKIISKIEESL